MALPAIIRSVTSFQMYDLLRLGCEASPPNLSRSRSLLLSPSLSRSCSFSRYDTFGNCGLVFGSKTKMATDKKFEDKEDHREHHQPPDVGPVASPNTEHSTSDPKRNTSYIWTLNTRPQKKQVLHLDAEHQTPKETGSTSGH